jgi:hypothetical protein
MVNIIFVSMTKRIITPNQLFVGNVVQAMIIAMALFTDIDTGLSHPLHKSVFSESVETMIKY